MVSLAKNKYFEMSLFFAIIKFRKCLVLKVTTSIHLYVISKCRLHSQCYLADGKWVLVSGPADVERIIAVIVAALDSSGGDVSWKSSLNIINGDQDYMQRSYSIL